MFISPRATTLSLLCNEAPDIPQPAEAAHKATVPLTMIDPAELFRVRSSTAEWQRLAVMVGFSVPLLLRRLGIDPALAGSVVLVTLTDLVGFVAILGLGTWLLV